jgi:hypothetical protein
VLSPKTPAPTTLILSSLAGIGDILINIDGDEDINMVPVQNSVDEVVKLR